VEVTAIAPIPDRRTGAPYALPTFHCSNCRGDDDAHLTHCLGECRRRDIWLLPAQMDISPPHLMASQIDVTSYAGPDACSARYADRPRSALSSTMLPQ